LKAIQEKKTIKEIFKELWLKYGDYNKCIEELKKVGINTTKDYLKVLRRRLNLPEKHEIIFSRKCFYCNNPAERISYKFSTTSEPIAICKKCYNKLHSKEMYKKHKIKIIRRHSAFIKLKRFYLGSTVCPICGAKGYLVAEFSEWLPTKHKIGPYFFIGHQYYTKYGRRRRSFICRIGKNQDLFEKYSHLLPLCNCKKCRIKRGEINGSNTERENDRRDI